MKPGKPVEFPIVAVLIKDDVVDAASVEEAAGLDEAIGTPDSLSSGEYENDGILVMFRGPLRIAVCELEGPAKTVLLEAANWPLSDCTTGWLEAWNEI